MGGHESVKNLSKFEPCTYSESKVMRFLLKWESKYSIHIEGVNRGLYFTNSHNDRHVSKTGITFDLDYVQRPNFNTFLS